MKITLFFIAIIYSTMTLANSGSILATELSKEAFILKSIDYGTNIGLFKTTKGIVLVDPMPGSKNLDTLNNAVKDLYGEPVKFILNTHEHSDHSGGNAYFVEKGGILLDDAGNFTEIHGLLAKSHTVEDKVFFHKKSNSIFAGDIYDTSWHPTFYAGGLSGFNNTIEAILKLGNEESIIVPGHGKPTSKAELRLFRENTSDWVSRVKKLKNDGMTAIEIKNDAQIKIILERFNVEKRTDFIPDNAFVRFIERTLSVIEKGV
ncbi:MBL fold metallo-hydrolase [Microbulbifer halophilus]|uniref:beta-lactamase n=1 Tax=Microbulbifer halophilus TaxID=453963 RepID=A0ABW5EL16_9GAMM|nr:MBL fold metallo-hydrolase [Microbulbifer halophilus]MCW8128383.1 MBL fold metallo-hydrolase [Microbulbifer halophilus]